MGVFAHDAKYSVKLGNDMVIHDEAWLDVLVRSAESRDGIGVAAYNVYKGQADGIASFCGGSAMLITEAARNTVGCFCEDYSKYGEEDSDYGTRIRLAGLKNLYVPPCGMVEHTGAENASYGSPEADRRRSPGGGTAYSEQVLPSAGNVGRVKVKTLPRPSTDSTRMIPP